MNRIEKMDGGEKMQARNVLEMRPSDMYQLLPVCSRVSWRSRPPVQD